MWTREGQNMFELRISDSSSSIIFDQCKHRYSRSGYSQMSTNKNLYWTVLLAKILTTCKISLSFLILLSAIFFTAIVQSLVEFQKDHSTRPFNNWMIQTISSLFAGIIYFGSFSIFNLFLSDPHFLSSWTFLNRWKKRCAVGWIHGEIKIKAKLVVGYFWIS